MRALRVFTVGFTLLAAGHANAMSVTILDPYLVRPDHLGNLQLQSFLAQNPNLSSFEAAALAEDGVASGIVVVQTSSDTPVTISVQNAGEIASYNDRFLEHAPAAGSESLVVSDLWHTGGSYYAVALLQAPIIAPASQGLTFSGGATAVQDGQQVTSAMNFVLPPVVLVHGLWGDASSLSDTESYLDDAGRWYSQYVTPICYSKYLAFDAKTDPLSDGKHPCEVTSQSALETEINATLAQLDDDRIVAGRVDIVAHSMGGLVLRNYASQRGYTSPRNSMQGQFHTIATLDSPETGSLLANYLVDHRADKEKAPIYTTPGLIYSLLCGNSDVSNCFASIGYPLNAPSLPVKTGAVYALEPGSPSLNNPALVGPNVANSQWLAVSALSPKDSALALGVDTLIAALYKNPDAKDVPTVNSLLLNIPNDAIVDIDSQTNGAPDGHVVTLPKLSHTYLVGSLLTLLSGGTIDDDNVLQDDGVNKIAACWIASGGTGACFSPGENENTSHPAALSDTKVVDGIRIQAPQRVELGKPFTIVVRSLIPNATPKLSVFQEGEMGSTRVIAVSRVENDGNTTRFQVTPVYPGLVTFGVGAKFENTAALQKVQIRVDLPSNAPLEFKANTSRELVLTLSDDTRAATLRPYAIYPAPVGRVFLNSDSVKCDVPRIHGISPIYVAPDGMLHGLKQGGARIECRFGALRDNVRVIVRTTNQ